MLSGVLIYSYINGQLVLMLNKISRIDHDHEDDDNLNKFVM